MGKTIERIPQKSMGLLQGYSWPGNARELRNVIERAMILSKDPSLQLDTSTLSEGQASLHGTLEEVEGNHIIEVLDGTGWSLSQLVHMATVDDSKDATVLIPEENRSGRMMGRTFSVKNPLRN
jgi:transcriptional regulator of acetoin/glycerol metabolism